MSGSLACLLFIGSLSISEASAGLSESFFTDTETENAAISPALSPSSDKKFFGKDYPGDKRPKVDVFHFHHPYPAVQDSDDFDSDFVKDENSDNGYWKAQMEYDRLRHKLVKDKDDVAKALKSKTKAEDELHEAVKREKDQKEELKKKQAEEAAERVSKTSSSKGKQEEEKKAEYKVPEKKKNPSGVSSPGNVNVDTDAVKKAMENLEDCKKQLIEAREKLKKLMKELEEAKQKQQQTEAALDAAEKYLKQEEDVQKALDQTASKEQEQYEDAKADYLKHQRLMQTMEEDIKVAAEKVRAFRDAEDMNGGVYPTKSGAIPRYTSWIVSMIAMVGTFLLW